MQILEARATTLTVSWRLRPRWLGLQRNDMCSPTAPKNTQGMPTRVSLPLTNLNTRLLLSSLLNILILSAALISAPRASALEFTVSPEGVVTATGDIVPGDAEAIKKLITLEFEQKYRLVRDLVTVNLNSRGGSLIGGIRLGYALRELGVHTNVGPDQSCLSACALAFLGGHVRTVEGRLGVHAAGLASSNANNPNTTGVTQTQLFDSIQAMSAITTAYVHEMTGSGAVARLALTTSNKQVAVLIDAELASMRAITVARRPSQFGKVGFRCPTASTTSVLSIICTNLDIAQLDLELNELYGKIRALGASANLVRDQQAWLRYRNSCTNDKEPNGLQSIIQCVRVAYSIRRDQLQSIALDLDTRTTDQVRSNWAPIAEQK